MLNEKSNVKKLFVIIFELSIIIVGIQAIIQQDQKSIMSVIFGFLILKNIVEK